MNVTAIPEDQIEFDKVIVFNTAHITESDNKLLNDMAQGLYPEAELIVDGHDYGFRIYVPLDYTDDDFNAVVNTARKEGMSDEFSILLHIARTYKANWMKLDCDGSTYKQIPTFEW